MGGKKVGFGCKAFWQMLEYEKAIKKKRVKIRLDDVGIQDELEKKAEAAYMRDFNTILFPNEIRNQAYWDSFVQESAYEGKKLKPIIEDWETLKQQAQKFIEDI